MRFSDAATVREVYQQMLRLYFETNSGIDCMKTLFGSVKERIKDLRGCASCRCDSKIMTYDAHIRWHKSKLNGR